MLKEEGKSSRGGVAGGGWARICDSCQLAACSVYCRADSAYLCTGCDARCHAANQAASRHERVIVCEACERAPAAFTCKADAAALCITCDADIHSANPLARRHHRVPILPLLAPSHAHLCKPMSPEINLEDGFMGNETGEEVDEEDETSSWLLLNTVKNNNDKSNGFVFGSEVDGYFDLMEYNSCGKTQYHEHYYQKINEVSDSVVPVQFVHQEKKPSLQHEMEFEAPKTGFGYNGSISHSVSFSSMDASIVPDATMNDISNTHNRPPKGTIDLFSSPPLHMAPQFSLDREARVLRYREKRKMRKFEKTIRYASRKAYAETRPRIKGRFAKRTDVEIEVDQIFANSVMAESGYGIVPSF